MMRCMRTTVDLSPVVHSRAKELARARNVSLSAMVAELVTLGLVRLGEPSVVTIDEVSGLPTISIGQTLTSDDVAALIDDE